MYQIFNYNKKYLKTKNSVGFILAETIIAITTIVIVFVILLGIAFSSLNILGSIKKQTQAGALLKEEFEALRNFRDGTQWIGGLGSVNTGSDNPYYLIKNSNSWLLSSGTETIGEFTRKIIFDKVSRDFLTGNIETTYNQSRNDTDTIKVTILISWPEKTIQGVTYLTNWKNE